MTTTENRPPVEVRERPRSAGPRRRTTGDQSLSLLLAVYVAVLLIVAVAGGLLAQMMRGAS